MSVQAQDVAKYILEKAGDMSHMKLQKLVYYAQAWSLVWDDVPLFSDPIQAWVNGPVVRPVYDQLKGRFRVSASDISGDSSKLSETQAATIDRVIDFYAPRSAQWLSDLTHMEKPWQDARQGMHPGERGEQEITHESLGWYYGSLQQK